MADLSRHSCSVKSLLLLCWLRRKGALPRHGQSATFSLKPHTLTQTWQHQAAPLAVCARLTCGRAAEQSREVLQGRCGGRVEEWGWGGGWEVVEVKPGQGGSVPFPSYLPTDHSLSHPIPSSIAAPLYSLLWPMHLQPLSLGNKAEGFVYWRLEEKQGGVCVCVWVFQTAWETQKQQVQTVAVQQCCAMFQSGWLDMMQFDTKRASLSRLEFRLALCLGLCHNESI